MNENIYKTPESEIINKQSSSNTLASRWNRFFASIIDTIIMMLFLMPAMYFTGGFDGITTGKEPSFGYSITLGILGIIFFLVVNGKLLISSGQTIGKKLLNIKIVDLDGNLPEPKSHLLKRYSVYFLPGQIPIVGQIFSFVNILFIFGKEKRCIHDFAGGTKVVVSD